MEARRRIQHEKGSEFERRVLMELFTQGLSNLPTAGWDMDTNSQAQRNTVSCACGMLARNGTQ